MIAQDLVLNPRPPKKWWDKWFNKMKKQYPRSKESAKKYKERISKIVGRIWSGLRPETKVKFFKYYAQDNPIMNNPISLADQLELKMAVNRGKLIRRKMCEWEGVPLSSISRFTEFSNDNPYKKDYYAAIENIWKIQKKLYSEENPMRKVNLKVHPEVLDYLKRVKKDAKAGHLDAEEYWKGAAAGALIAGATNPMKPMPPEMNPKPWIPRAAYYQQLRDAQWQEIDDLFPQKNAMVTSVTNTLIWHKILTLKELISYSERELYNVLGGNSLKTIQVIKDALKAKGLYLRGDEPKTYPYDYSINPMKPMPPKMNPSEMEDYYNNVAHGGNDSPPGWIDEDPNRCGCRGRGWFLSNLDTWHKCPVHHKKGQRHPEDQDNPVMPPPFPSNIHFPGKLNPMLPMPPTMHIGKKPLIMPALPNPREVVLVIPRVDKRCAICNGIIKAGETCYRAEDAWGDYVYFHIRCWKYQHSGRKNPLPNYPWIPKDIHAQRNPFWADAGTGLGLGLGWSAAAVAVKAIADSVGKKRKKK
jgi:hypothetical protein